MAINKGMQSFEQVLKEMVAKKPPTYPWQDLALRIIDELSIPPQKRSAVFLVCKKYPKSFIEKCLNDTKELSNRADKWRYFFKLTNKT